MSKTYPKQLITLLLLLCGAAANAHDFEHNGIFYNILSATDNTVEVTFKGNAYDSSKGEYGGVVTIPSQVTHGDATYRVTGIGDCAFRQCEAVSSVIIPASVTSIGASAFSNCSGLTSIVSLIPADKLFAPNNDAFSNVPTSYCALYVPTGTKDTYANTEQWKDFTKIQEPNTDNIVNVLPSGAAAVYYDLNGRRVERPTRGIYIVNGKKVFIK